MIEHIFIKNYKAFARNNIPIDKNTLFIGTNSSGKTTILEALDLFFNNVLHYEYINDLKEDVIVELTIDDERYRKVFKSPTYIISYEECIGNMFEINHIKYLYVPSKIYSPKLLNDILTINLSEKPSSIDQAKACKILDYLDGKVGNDNYPFFKINTIYEFDIKKVLNYSKKEFTTLISNITYPTVILGIDSFENNFDLAGLKRITEYTYQTIITSKEVEVISHFDYSVQALYKDDITSEIDTITKSIHKSQNKKLLLVEGKYDVAWFEKALSLLGEFSNYRVIPCGGIGNIQFIKEQIEKEGFETVVITDGDTRMYNPLYKEVIELYADVEYINYRFNTTFNLLPRSKREFFRKFNDSDDVVKKVLSSWAKRSLTIDNPFVSEVKAILDFKGEF